LVPVLVLIAVDVSWSAPSSNRRNFVRGARAQRFFRHLFAQISAACRSRRCPRRLRSAAALFVSAAVDHRFESNAWVLRLM
jgi:hypothetical protein